MQCQVCKRKQADKIFYIYYENTFYQMPVCSDCLQKRWQAAVSSGQAESFKRAISEWTAGSQTSRGPDFP